MVDSLEDGLARELPGVHRHQSSPSLGGAEPRKESPVPSPGHVPPPHAVSGIARVVVGGRHDTDAVAALQEGRHPVLGPAVVGEDLDAPLQPLVVPLGVARPAAVVRDGQQILVPEVLRERPKQVFNVAGLPLRAVVLPEIAVVVLQKAAEERHLVGRRVDVVVSADLPRAAPFVAQEGDVLSRPVVAPGGLLDLLPHLVRRDVGMVADGAEVERGVAAPELEHFRRRAAAVRIPGVGVEISPQDAELRRPVVDQDGIAAAFPALAVAGQNPVAPLAGERHAFEAMRAPVRLAEDVGPRDLRRIGVDGQRHGGAIARRGIAETVVEPHVDPAAFPDRPVGRGGHDQLASRAALEFQRGTLGQGKEFPVPERIHEHPLLEGGLVHRLDLHSGRARAAVAEHDLDSVAGPQVLAIEDELVDALPGKILEGQSQRSPSQGRSGRGRVRQEVGAAGVALLETHSAPHVPFEVVLGGDAEPSPGRHPGLPHSEAEPELAVSADRRGDGGLELGPAHAEFGGARLGVLLGRVAGAGLVGLLAGQRSGQGQQAGKDGQGDAHGPTILETATPSGSLCHHDRQRWHRIDTNGPRARCNGN